MITIDVLLTEHDMAESFLAELKNNNLPEQFFYWFPLSVRAWLNLCSDGAYKNFMRSLGLIEDNAADIASHLPKGEVEVISLGAGQGNKDLVILKALRASQHTVTYRPVDSSQALLELACANAADAGFSCRGTKANIASPAQIFTPHTDNPRLVLLLGNTLGAFDPVNYIQALHKLLRPGDYLLVDGEYYAETTTIAGYDNPLNRQFAFAPLHSVGITEADGDLQFQLQEDQTLPGLYRLTKYFLPHHTFPVQVAGQSLTVEQQVKIEMSYSGKYTQGTFRHLIEQIGIMTCHAEYSTPDQSFGMMLASLR